MKKVLRIIGIVFFGYIGLASIAIIMRLQKDPSSPEGMLVTFGIIGAVSIFLIRILWKQLKATNEKK